MDAYLELLKVTYYQERKKLQEMAIFNQEGKLRFLALQKEILERAKDNLSISQILGRGDITEEIKENLLRDREKAEKIEAYLDKTIKNQQVQVEKDEEAELDNAQYVCEDYAQYLLQLDKVAVLESELENSRLMSDMVYEEQRIIAEGKNKNGGEE